MADDAVDGRPTFGGRLLRAVRDGAIALEREGQPLGEAGLRELPLRDFHALRDAAERLGVIAPEPEPFGCRNCDAELAPDPTEAPVDDLERWYADDTPPPEPPFELADGTRIVMRPVTVAEALPLWRAVAGRGALHVTPRLVGALGVQALGGETDPAKIARALDRASDETWLAAESLFALLNYADHAHAPAVCRACGAVHDVPAPSSREVEEDPELLRRLLEPEAVGAPEAAPAEGFPDEDRFATAVERIGEEVYEEQGVRNIDLRVDFEVPPVDGSGEPLMGSYEPRYETDAAGYTAVEFVITVYYRTFARMWEQDGPFDVHGEIRETIEHEIEHHLHHLAGHDPKDEQERREARRELERTFGERTVRRAEVAGWLAELRRIGVLLAIIAALLGATIGVLYALGILRD